MITTQKLFERVVVWAVVLASLTGCGSEPEESIMDKLNSDDCKEVQEGIDLAVKYVENLKHQAASNDPVTSSTEEEKTNKEREGASR